MATWSTPEMVVAAMRCSRRRVRTVFPRPAAVDELVRQRWRVSATPRPLSTILSIIHLLIEWGGERSRIDDLERSQPFIVGEHEKIVVPGDEVIDLPTEGSREDLGVFWIADF